MVETGIRLFSVSYKSASAGNSCACRSGSSENDAAKTSVSNLLDDLEAVFERHGAVRLLPQRHFHGGHVAVCLDLTKTGLVSWDGAIKKLQSSFKQDAEGWERGGQE